MFTYSATIDGPHRIAVGFTDARGGHSAPPYGEFNLGGMAGEEHSVTEANRSLLAAHFGAPRSDFVMLRQVHGREVVHVTGPWPDRAPEADALVTTNPDLILGVLAADCTPILLADSATGVIGSAHAGRKGMQQNIVSATVSAMRDLGARHITAVVGPSICGRCYEVPAEMAQEAVAVAPASAARSWTGTPAIDVAAGVVEQLVANDVVVQWIPGCTRERDDLYSYRRAPISGRAAGVITRRERVS